MSVQNYHAVQELIKFMNDSQEQEKLKHIIEVNISRHAKLIKMRIKIKIIYVMFATKVFLFLQ